MSTITMKRLQTALLGSQLLNEKQREIEQFEAMFLNILRAEDIGNLPVRIYSSDLPPGPHGQRRLQLLTRSISRGEKRVQLMIWQQFHGDEMLAAAHPQGSLTRGLIIPVWEKLPDVLDALIRHLPAVGAELNFYEDVTLRVATLAR